MGKRVQRARRGSGAGKASGGRAKGAGLETDEALLREALHRMIDGLVVGRASVEGGMESLIAAGEAMCPSALWHEWRRVDWKAGSAQIEKSMRTQLRTRPPKRAKALAFICPELYMNPGEIAWGFMSNFAPGALRPANGPIESAPYDFVMSRALESARRRAKPFANVSEDAFYDGSLAFMVPMFVASVGFTCLAAAAATQRLAAQMLPTASRQLGVVCGSAEAEIHTLGVVTEQGWLPIPSCNEASFSASREGVAGFGPARDHGGEA